MIVKQKKVQLNLPPKLHVSSPKRFSDPRGHSDYIELDPLMKFLQVFADVTPAIVIMIEAKRKDEALLKLMDEFRTLEAAGEPIRAIDGGSLELLG